MSKKYSLKISQILCLFSLVTAALAGVDVLKTKVRRISEVLFDGFLRSTSDIFPLLLVSVSLSWRVGHPTAALSLRLRLIGRKHKSLVVKGAITPLAGGALSRHTPTSHSRSRRWVAFLQTWQTCRGRRKQWSRPSSRRPHPPPSSHPRSLAVAP